jgi:hypothetical protein
MLQALTAPRASLYSCQPEGPWCRLLRAPGANNIGPKYLSSEIHVV